MAATAPAGPLLVVLPTDWDLEELTPERQPGWRFEAIGRHRDELAGGFDPLAFVRASAARWRGAASGVLGTDDYLACVLGPALARELGLPGPAPETVLLCQHKYYCRLEQRRLVPRATPRFEVAAPVQLDPEQPPLPYPFFLKPVRGTFSLLARRVDGPGDMLALFHNPPGPLDRGLALLEPFHQLLRHYGDGRFLLDGRRFLLEELLSGCQVTVEGFVHRGRATVMGVVDSVLHPATGSFLRFEYPSRLPQAVQDRMGAIAATLMEGIGFDAGLFNVEMFHDAGRDDISIIEVNPRMSYQFADLHEKVDGTGSYSVAVALAAGKEPRWRARNGPFRTAASFVLRTDRDAVVRRVPDEEDLERLRRRFPEARVRTFHRPGERLSAAMQDGCSFRYGLVHLGGDGEADLKARCAEALAMLPFELAD
ncbi:MAG: ATP-grasp domain-containing protein [Planctomycetota bacterium]|nr:MAG: ATP-grasp domain-containing protein [Planctomycetota bacterium]